MFGDSMGYKHRHRVEPIPLHRVAIVRPFARFLADVGVPVEREFQRVGLPFHALENVDNYLPSRRFWALLINASRRAGIEDLGYRVGHKFGANSADPKLTSLLFRSPTLYQGLLQASELINKTVSHCRVGVINPPQSRHAYVYHRPSCDTDNPAINQIGWFGVMALLGMVRVFTGPQWPPPEIGVMTKFTPSAIREQFPDARIRRSPQYSYIALDKVLLSRPPFTQGAMGPRSSLLRYEPARNNLRDSLTQVLIAYVQDYDLRVDLAAQFCGMSTRTLQRRLKDIGTHYSEILDQSRFHVACQMLQDPDMSVTDIAHLLRYDDASHFSRAFRRIAGITPRTYRRADSTTIHHT